MVSLYHYTKLDHHTTRDYHSYLGYGTLTLVVRHGNESSRYLSFEKPR